MSGDPPQVPLLVVGSLVVGGAGKTPIAAFLASRFSKSVKCALVCRGWGGRLRDAKEVQVSDTVSAVGDEAILLRQRLPAGVRVYAGQSLEATRRLASRWADVVVSDDGYQTPELRRTQQIVVHNPLEKDDVVPNGRLRESLEALERADLRWAHLPTLSLAERATNYLNYEVVSHYAISELVTTHGQVLPVDWLCGRKVVAACGLGYPESFVTLIERAGAQVTDLFLGGDHRMPRLREIKPYARRQPVLITEKDAVKWPHAMEAVVVKVEVKILRGTRALDAKMLSLVGRT